MAVFTKSDLDGHIAATPNIENTNNYKQLHLELLLHSAKITEHHLLFASLIFLQM